MHVLLVYIYMYIQEKLTPLWVASRNGAEDIVELLISAGASVHLSNTVSLAINNYRHNYCV